ncbi:hypothetical protein Bsph_1292 [Lysinibacillus sphaericus C3-41]|uniref:Uncharacterized protein n=1 Tax=Lysinibacillus sphaericus (strain C3-41) TaxID=444177 RepID=B1HP48_LYSSC|nr:hypothetical protein Bsph_1292 [Lysinibacillus sphaericus C3-41]
MGLFLKKMVSLQQLTIHDNDKQDLTDAMMNMAATISKK